MVNLTGFKILLEDYTRGFISGWWLYPMVWNPELNTKGKRRK